MYASVMTDLVEVQATPDRSVALAAKHGFDGVDLRLTHYFGWLEQYGPERFIDHMAWHGVRAGYGSMLTRTLSAAPDEWAHMLEQLPRIARVAEALGFTRAGVVVLPFDDRLDAPANRKRHLDRLAQAAPVLADHGVRIGLEYVSPISRRAGKAFGFVHDMAGMRELIADANQPNVGLMLDSFHWHGAEESPADIEALSADQVVVVHINDVPAGTPVERLDIRDRLLPGESGVIDIAGFLGGLKSIGYRGPITSEPTHERWKRSAEDEAIAQTAQAVLGVLEAAGSGPDRGAPS